MNLSSVYQRMPRHMQNSMISAYGYYWKWRRFGGQFYKHLEIFTSRENWSNDQWINYQTNELRKILAHAYNNVPFYREKYKEAGIIQEDFLVWTLEDMTKLPYLEKEDLRKYGNNKLMASNHARGSFYSSSGSTGTPTKIFFSPEFHQVWSAAYEARCRFWGGVNRHMSRGMIGGRLVVPSTQRKPPFYRFNRAENQYYFSINHLSIDTVESYLCDIRKSGIEYFTGYANSVWLIAKFALDLGLPSLKLKSVITSSEKLTKAMRDDIESFYGCKVFDTYSGIEACGLVSECDYGSLHWSPDIGIIETLSLNTMDGNLSELVCTGLLNYDQPLIRYRIGDLIEVDEAEHCGCGRCFPIIKEIVGRTDDIVTLRDGRRLGSFNRFFSDIRGIRKVQVFQRDYDEFELKIVPSNEFSDETRREIRASFNKRIGNVRLYIVLVDEIPTKNNGKFKAVISRLNQTNK